MKIGIIQYSPKWESIKENLDTVKNLIEKHATNEDVIILPEMSLTGFTMNAAKFAEDIDGFTVSNFIELSSKLKKHFLVGIIEWYNGRIYNTLFHFNKEGIITARYRKIHPFSFAKEDEYYSPGDEPLITKINDAQVGLSVCYDLRFPELYRLYAKKRVDVLVNIANWPVTRIEHWRQLLKARAIENQCFMIGVNRTGSDPFYDYNGNSAVFNPMGEQLLLLNDEITFQSLEINPAEAKDVQNKFKFLDDIRLI